MTHKPRHGRRQVVGTDHLGEVIDVRRHPRRRSQARGAGGRMIGKDIVNEASMEELDRMVNINVNTDDREAQAVAARMISAYLTGDEEFVGQVVGDELRGWADDLSLAASVTACLAALAATSLRSHNAIAEHQVDTRALFDIVQRTLGWHSGDTP